MSLIGVTHGGDPIGRWLEGHPERVGCVEVAVEGPFLRPTPYLSWLGAQFPLLIRASGLSIGSPSPLSSERLADLAALCRSTRVLRVVCTVGFNTSNGIRLPAPVPISLTPQSLRTVEEHVANAASVCGCSSLIEPIASPLRCTGLAR